MKNQTEAICSQKVYGDSYKQKQNVTTYELKNIKINDSFWSRYTQLVRDEVIFYQYKALRDEIDGAAKSCCIDNFIKVARIANDIKNSIDVPVYPVNKWEYTDENSDKNTFNDWAFQDTDIYK